MTGHRGQNPVRGQVARTTSEHRARLRGGDSEKREEGMAKKLFVGNLSWNTDDQGLREAFSPFGEIEEATVITDRGSGRSRGFGFVTFEDDEAADKAISALNDSEIDGRTIKVDVAKERSRDRGRGGDYGGSRW